MESRPSSFADATIRSPNARCQRRRAVHVRVVAIALHQLLGTEHAPGAALIAITESVIRLSPSAAAVEVGAGLPAGTYRTPLSSSK